MDTCTLVWLMCGLGVAATIAALILVVMVMGQSAEMFT